MRCGGCGRGAGAGGSSLRWGPRESERERGSGQLRLLLCLGDRRGLVRPPTPRGRSRAWAAGRTWGPTWRPRAAQPTSPQAQGPSPPQGRPHSAFQPFGAAGAHGPGHSRHRTCHHGDELFHGLELFHGFQTLSPADRSSVSNRVRKRTSLNETRSADLSSTTICSPQALSTLLGLGLSAHKWKD